MAVNILKGNTLGQKHLNYNLQIKKAIENNEADIDFQGDDLRNLAKIDIASHNRNLEFILKVLEDKDLLYVSRAINKCTWLIIDDTYNHIIDPDYLSQNLFPNMTSKAKLKLTKHIRKNITNEALAEKFFSWEDSISKCLKWLPKCSISFIEEKVKQHYNEINPKLLKRLCERTVKVINILLSKMAEGDFIITEKRYRSTINCFRKTNINIYLDIFEKITMHKKIKFNARTTTFIMKSCPQRVFENFHKYAQSLHLYTFSKFVKDEDVKEFLYKQAILIDSFDLSLLRFFILRLPKEQQFQFVNDVFITKIHETAKTSAPDSELSKMNALHSAFKGCDYKWYEFAPFEIAFEEIVKLIKTSPNIMWNDLLVVLIKSTRNNCYHILLVLKYYQSKHLKDNHNLKAKFINDLFSITNVFKYDEKNWEVVDEIFKTMDVYTESDKDVTKCVEIVLIYKLINDQPLPEIIKTKFQFNSLQKYNRELKKNENEKVFNYLFNYGLHRIPNYSNIEEEVQLAQVIDNLKDLLTIIKNWNRKITDFPVVLKKIKEITEVKVNSKWKIDFSSLYDVKKSWRKYMFEESLLLKQSEEVCLNALKHDPTLLTRHDNKAMMFALNNEYGLKRFLSKLRIYWPNTISKEWVEKYMSQLDQVKLHRAIVRGLFVLLPEELINNFIKEYLPKIASDWGKVDDSTLNLTKQIARNMHRARPQPSPEAVLSYARGNYLQFAIPSLLAIYYNLSFNRSKEHIPKLLDARVSLQKHGIRFAIMKLDHKDVMQQFSQIWSHTKNTTVRCTLFTSTYNLISKETNTNKIDELWHLLKMFIDNLTFKEDKKIYKLLFEVEKIPSKIRPNYIESSYRFMESYLLQIKDQKEVDEIKYSMKSMVVSSTDIIEFMNEDFVLNVITEFIDKEYMMKKLARGTLHDNMVTFISTYIFCSQDEEIQNKRYNNILLPLLCRSILELDSKKHIKDNLYKCLDNLRQESVNYAVKNNKIIPVKLFSDIFEKLNCCLKIPEHYVILRQWKLTLELIKIIKDSISKDRRFPDNWKEDDAEEPVRYGMILLEMLKNDIASYFPSIVIVFETVIVHTFEIIVDSDLMIKFVNTMLSDIQFIPAYLVAIKLYKDQISNEKWTNIFTSKVLNHPSSEVRTHFNYYCKI